MARKRQSKKLTLAAIRRRSRTLTADQKELLREVGALNPITRKTPDEIKLMKQSAAEMRASLLKKKEVKHKGLTKRVAKALRLAKRSKKKKGISPEIFERKRRLEKYGQKKLTEYVKGGEQFTVFHIFGYFAECREACIDWISENFRARDAGWINVYNKSHSFGTRVAYRDELLMDLTGGNALFFEPTQKRPGSALWLKRETKAHWEVTRIRKV